MLSRQCARFSRQSTSIDNVWIHLYMAVSPTTFLTWRFSSVKLYFKNTNYQTQSCLLPTVELSPAQVLSLTPYSPPSHSTTVLGPSTIGNSHHRLSVRAHIWRMAHWKFYHSSRLWNSWTLFVHAMYCGLLPVGLFNIQGQVTGQPSSSGKMTILRKKTIFHRHTTFTSHLTGKTASAVCNQVFP